MATSDNTILTLTRDDLINTALRKIGVVGEGATANTQQLNEASSVLNPVILELQTFGLFLWKREELSISFVENQSDYVIGDGLAIDTPFPHKVLQAVIRHGGTTNIDMELLSRNEFNQLPVGSSGSPIKGSYQPKINSGTFSVWPKPDASAVTNTTLLLTYQRPIDVFTSGTQTLDMPQIWYNAIIYSLASALADDYSLPLEDRRWFEKQADKKVSMVLAYSGEETSIYFSPEKG